MITKLANDYSGLTDEELNNKATKAATLGIGGGMVGMGSALSSAATVPNAIINTSTDYQLGKGSKGQKLLAAAKKNKGAIGLAAGTLGLMGAGAGASNVGINQLRGIETELYENRPHLLSQPE